MRFLFFFLLFSFTAQAQLAPFIDFNGYFRTFYKNNFRQLEFQPIQSFVAGDNMVAYIDNRGDFKIYNGEEIIPLTNMNVQFKMSDYLLAWNIGPGLYYLDGKDYKMLTTFSREYVVTDSLIVFEDTRFNTVSVVYNNRTYPLFQVTGDLFMPEIIGDDIIAFKSSGDFYKVFWKGRIYDLGVWMGNIKFNAGTSMLAFNDPTQNTFAVFENGEFLDVENRYVNSYKSGRGFVVYEDVSGNLFHYAKGKKTELSNFTANFWDVNDDIAVWSENGSVYAFVDGQKTMVSTYIPKDYQIKNKVFVFRNLMGGVSVFADGRVTEITNQSNATYVIYGNLVLVEMFNKSFIVYNDGKLFEA